MSSHTQTEHSLEGPSPYPADLFEAGRTAAAVLPEPTRTQVYRRWYRTSDHLFARGFRSYVITSGRGNA